MADFRLVYRDSRSMRWAEVIGFDAFCDTVGAFPLSFTGRFCGGSGCKKESERVSAAGSMSGMVDLVVLQQIAPAVPRLFAAPSEKATQAYVENN